MNVAYHSSNEFARILGVSIVSLLENNKVLDEINVYIIERGITTENKKVLNSIAEKYKRNIFFIPMPDINTSEDLRLVRIKKNWLFDSYCRIFLDILLPAHIEKVLYLDSDVLVTDCLSDLWNTELENNVAAGVKDCISKDYFGLLGIEEGAHYCNSGMILVNLKKWREDKMREKIRQYIRERNGYVFFSEQTVLNGVIQKQWLILDARYNVNTLMMALSYKDIQTLRRIHDFYSEAEVKRAVENPAIIHMTSVFLIRNRVWIEGSNHPAKPIYEKYKAMTPWANEKDIPDKRTTKDKIKDKIIDIVPWAILLPVASFVYNNIRVNNIKRCMEKYSGVWS